jgi:hypothetical protein
MNDVSKWTLTTTATGEWVRLSKGGLWSMSAAVAGSGAVSATVLVEGSNDPSDANQTILVATLSPSGTDADADSAVGQASWAYARARRTAISANTTLTATLAVG